MHEGVVNGHRAPWWATALDVVALIVLALAVRSWIGPNYSIEVAGDIRLSLRSWPRVAVWFVALLAIRHLVWRAVPWHARVWGWIRAARRWEPVRAAWAPFVVSRALVLVAAFVAVWSIGFDPPRPWRALDHEVLDLFARWDSGWYYTIAATGYPGDPSPERTSAIAFFPGLPLAMRGAAAVLHVNLWIAGIVIVIGGFLGALVYVYRLARLDLTADESRAAVTLLAFYPFAFCYSAILTEGLFLLSAAAAFYHFRRDERWKAGLFGLGAGLLRPNGFLLSVPLGLIACLDFASARGWLTSRGGEGQTTGRLLARLAIAALPGIGMLTFALYVRWLTGDALAWVEAQQAWGRKTWALFALVAARADLVASQGMLAYLRMYNVEFIEAAAALLALVAVWPIVRRFGLAYGVFVALAVIPPLVSMGPVSLGRYTAPLFPIFLWLGAAVPPERRGYWLAAFAGGQALLSVLFFTWRPPY